MSPQPDPGPALVPIRTFLKGSTFLVLERFANAHHTTVAVVLAHLADKATATKPRRERRGWNRMTPEKLARARQLLDAGDSPTRVAAEIGVSVASLDNYLSGRRTL